MTEQEKSKKQLQQVADLAESISNDIGNLAGTACLLRIDLDDSDKVVPVHRMTMATIQSLLDRLSEDADRLTGYIATLQHEQMKKNIVYVPMSEYEAVNRDIERCRAKYGMK